MSVSAENRDFRKYREEGDTEALARVFDAVAPRLLLLAVHLAPDHGQAEDLVQTTFLQGMRDGERWDGKRPVARWMAGILHHRAVDLQRRTGIRSHLPLAEAPTTDLDPAELAEDQELYDRVVAAIEGLPAPYREVLALRVRHGLKAKDIAQALGRSPGTVRMQLKRGLERLRSVLPERSSLLGLYLLEPARGLDVVKESVLAEAGTGALVATAGGAIVGGLVVMKSALAFVVLLALSALAWHVSGEGATSVPEALAQEEMREARVQAPVEQDPAEGMGTAPERERRELAPGDDSDPNPAALAQEVLVRYASDGQPASDVGVYVRRADGAALGTEQRTDEAGLASFADLGDDEYVLFVDRLDRGLPFEGRRGEPLVVEIPRGLQVLGQVLDLEQDPVPGARILRLNPRHHDVLQPVATTDEAGRFELRDVAPGTEFVARVHGFQPSELESADGKEGESCDVELVMGARGHRLRGRVVNEQGQPVPHAWVALGVDEDAREELRGSDESPQDQERRKAMDLEGILLRADERGRFESHEVPAGYVLAMARPLDRSSDRVAAETLWINFGEEAEVVLTLQRGAVVEGVIMDSDGRPVAGANLEAEWEGTARLGQMEDDIGPWMSDRWATSEEDGSFRLPGLLAGDYDLRVNGKERELFMAQREIGEGEHVLWNPVVEPQATLRVRLLGPSGEPLSGWAVGVAKGSQGRPGWEHFLEGTDREGLRVIRELNRDEELQVFAYAPRGSDGYARLPSTVRPGISPAVGDYELRLTPEEFLTGSVKGRLVQGEGSPAERTRVTLRMDSGADQSLQTDREGRFLFESVPAGTYQLVHARDLQMIPLFEREPPAVLLEFDLAPGEQRDLGMLKLEGQE